MKFIEGINHQETESDKLAKAEFFERSANRGLDEKYSYSEVAEIVHLLKEGAHVGLFNEAINTEYITELKSSDGDGIRIFKHQYPWNFGASRKYDEQGHKIQEYSDQQYRQAFENLLDEMEQGLGRS